jgi:hypothetical protein
MPRTYRFKQFLRNISGGFTGLREELTAGGIGTEMWTEQLEDVMIQGRKCALFLVVILL